MKTSIAALLASVIAMPALAGGMTGKMAEPVIETPVSMPAPARMYDWTGAYVGATVGYGHATSSGPQPSESGAVGGLHVGYNMDFGTYVLGVELDGAPSALTNIASGGAELGSGARLKLRAGAKLGATGNTFAFGTLGAAVAKTENAGTSHTDTGFLVGIGASHGLSDSWVVTGEVAHHRFNDVAGTTNNVRATTGTVGLSFRF